MDLLGAFGSCREHQEQEPHMERLAHRCVDCKVRSAEAHHFPASHGNAAVTTGGVRGKEGQSIEAAKLHCFQRLPAASPGWDSAARQPFALPINFPLPVRKGKVRSPAGATAAVLHNACSAHSERKSAAASSALTPWSATWCGWPARGPLTSPAAPCRTLPSCARGRSTP